MSTDESMAPVFAALREAKEAWDAIRQGYENDVGKSSYSKRVKASKAVRLARKDLKLGLPGAAERLRQAEETEAAAQVAIMQEVEMHDRAMDAGLAANEKFNHALAKSLGAAEESAQ